VSFGRRFWIVLSATRLIGAGKRVRKVRAADQALPCPSEFVGFDAPVILCIRVEVAGGGELGLHNIRAVYNNNQQSEGIAGCHLELVMIGGRQGIVPIQPGGVIGSEGVVGWRNQDRYAGATRECALRWGFALGWAFLVSVGVRVEVEVRVGVRVRVAVFVLVGVLVGVRVGVLVAVFVGFDMGPPDAQASCVMPRHRVGWSSVAVMPE